MIESFDQLHEKVATYGEAKGLPFEVYDANTGKKMRAVEVYIEDGAFCLDVENAEQS